MNTLKLSVIMPLFNVEETIRLALDSILMQKIDFDYEIITVNDCSTDNTLSILKEYAAKFSQIKIIEHKENQGNAMAFYNALCAASGDYFCVLDGDDYYTVKNKLQKQVDFLDGDKEEAYTAVVHKYLRVNKAGKIWNDSQLFSSQLEYDYFDFIRRRFYFHTSTFMYRNIFKGNVPECFKEELMRGDNPRTFMHLLYTKGKVKVLDFIGSVYFYTQKGIWSQTSQEEQVSRNVRMWDYLCNKFPSVLEKSWYSFATEWQKKNPPKSADPANWIYPDVLLNELKNMSNRFAFKERDFAFCSLYKSAFIDSFCESLGFVAAVQNQITPYTPLKSDNENVLITISNLTTTGGGVYYEIKDIIKMYSEKKVYLLLTDIDNIESIDAKVVEQLKEFPNLILLYGQSELLGRLTKLVNVIKEVKPSKIYHYCGHNNTHAVALIQSVFAKNICVFSFDHGFSLGLDNTSYDTYITKRSMDYKILNKHYADKVIYIPCWNEDKMGANNYVPFKNHDKLITACGAARYYKLAGAGYIDLVLDLLKETGGRHYHYGPIDENELINIQRKLEEKELEPHQFIHIPWADNIALSMLINNVDIFIEPFPVVSYKLTLEMLSAGIPVFCRKANLRLSITDFIYENNLSWSNNDDFIINLKGLNKELLEKHSKRSREYYLENHLPSKIFSFFEKEENYKQPEAIKFWDNKLIDVANIKTTIEAGKKQ